MTIDRIDTTNTAVSNCFHSRQPDVPNKNAAEMKDFFDAMPKKVLIPKINEVIDELNSGNYGKSAYTLAKEAGFEGTEAEWLKSLEGKQGPQGIQGVEGKQGPKGDAGIDEIVSVDAITTSGFYNHDNDLYTAKTKPWNTDLSVPFKYTGDGAIPEFEFNYGTIKIDGGLGVIPLLKYRNTQGDMHGATYIFLRADNECFDVYVSDLVDATPWFVDSYGFIGDDIVDLSNLITEQFTVGLGEDIYGNWALISKYFVENELDVDKVATDSCVANALKGNKKGDAVVLSDVSPLEHELKIKVSGVSDLASVTVSQYGKNLLPYPYNETSITRQGITFTDNGDGSITINGTTTTTFTTFSLNTANVKLIDGVTYSLYKVPNDDIVLYFQYKNENNEDRWGVGGFTWKDSYTYKQCYLQIKDANKTFVNLTIYPQLEISETPTEFKPYIAPITASVNADGTVRCLKSIYPTTTLTTDKKSALIDVEYNRDINKAFAELLQIIKGS